MNLPSTEPLSTLSPIFPPSLATDYTLQKKSLTYLRKLFNRLLLNEQLGEIEKTVSLDLCTIRVAQNCLNQKACDSSEIAKVDEAKKFKRNYVVFFGGFLSSLLDSIKSAKKQRKKPLESQAPKVRAKSNKNNQKLAKKKVIPPKKPNSIYSKGSSLKSNSVYGRNRVISNIRSVMSREGSRRKSSQERAVSINSPTHSSCKEHSVNASRKVQDYVPQNTNLDVFCRIKQQILVHLRNMKPLTKLQIDKYNKFLKICRPLLHNASKVTVDKKSFLSQLHDKLSQNIDRQFVVNFLNNLSGHHAPSRRSSPSPSQCKSLFSKESEQSPAKSTQNAQKKRRNLSINSEKHQKIMNQSQNHSLSSDKQSATEDNEQSNSCPLMESNSSHCFRIRHEKEPLDLKKRSRNLDEYQRKDRRTRLDRVNFFEKIGEIINKEIRFHMSVLDKRRSPRKASLGDSGFGSEVEESMRNIQRLAPKKKKSIRSECKSRRQQNAQVFQKSSQFGKDKSLANSVYKESTINNADCLPQPKQEMGFSIRSLNSSTGQQESSHFDQSNNLSIFSNSAEKFEASPTKREDLDLLSESENSPKQANQESVNFSIQELQFESQKMLCNHKKKISLDLGEMLEVISPPNVVKEKVADRSGILRNNSNVVNCDKGSDLGSLRLTSWKGSAHSKFSKSSTSLQSQEILSINSHSQSSQTCSSQQTNRNLSLFSDAPENQQNSSPSHKKSQSSQSDPQKSQKNKSLFSSESESLEAPKLGVQKQLQIKKKSLISKRIAQLSEKENMNISNLMKNSNDQGFSQELNKSLMRLENNGGDVVNSRYHFEEEAEAHIKDLVNDVRFGGLDKRRFDDFLKNN